VLVVAIAAACPSPSDQATHVLRADSIARVRQDSISRARPDYVVDSILPTDEALRRFRAALGGDSVTRFAGGSRSRAALVEHFIDAVAHADTAELRRMAVTAREFADLYYLESPYSRPPYRQPPQLAWALIQRPSSAGLTRLIRESAGKRIHYVSHTCDGQLVHEGRTTRHPDCRVVTREGLETSPPRDMFGTILEFDGQFKFLSYTTRR
jgi:hypothetical protein